MDHFTVHVDAVSTIGTVLDGVPGQGHSVFIFEDTGLAGLQVRRSVEVRGEAEHRTQGDALVRRAGVAALVNTPEVVGVVIQSHHVGDTEGLGEVAGPFTNVGGGVVRLVIRPVGAAEDQTILVAVVVERPAERQVVLRDVVGVIFRIDASDRLDRARQFFEVDAHLKVFASGGSHQVVGASQHVQAFDDGTSGVGMFDGLIGINRDNLIINVELDVSGPVASQ